MNLFYEFYSLSPYQFLFPDLGLRLVLVGELASGTTVPPRTQTCPRRGIG
jgi:hypothetical protein